MKVILRQDIENLGKMGDLVTVKDGYGRNYLIPRSYAYYASEKATKRLVIEKKQYAIRQDKLKASAQTLAGKLADIQISVPMKVGEEGRIFGSVTAQMIANELTTKGFDIDKRLISIEEQIKNLGVFDVKVKLHSEVNANLKVWVIAAE